MLRDFGGHEFIFKILLDMHCPYSHSINETPACFPPVKPTREELVGFLTHFKSHFHPFLRPRIFLPLLILQKSFPPNNHHLCTRLWILISLIFSEAISLAFKSCCSFLNSLQLGKTIIQKKFSNKFLGRVQLVLSKIVWWGSQPQP